LATNYLVTQPGPVCTGPASPTPHLAWGVYSGAVLSGLVAGQQAALQIDSMGNLLVNVAVGGGGGGGGGTVTQGPPGLVTAPWFVELSDGTNPVGTDANPLRIDPTGTTVQPVSGLVMARGDQGPATFPFSPVINPVIIGGWDPNSSSVVTAQFNSSGQLAVVLNSSPFQGTGGTATGVVDVVGFTNGSGNVAAATPTTPLPVIQSGLNPNNAINSTTGVNVVAGQSPTGTALPLLADASGNLFVNDVPAFNTPAPGTITAQDTGSSTATGANGQQIITGTITPGSDVEFYLPNANDYATFTVQVTGVWTGALSIEVTQDGVNWFPATLIQTGTASEASTFTGNFIGTVNGSGFLGLRVRATRAWTGTASVQAIQSQMLAQVGITGLPATTATPSGAALPVTLLPQVPGNSGVVQPQLVKTDPTTNDLLKLMIGEMKAMRIVLSHLASEDGTARFNDFDPTVWVDTDENFLS
jgi:hypothetical protein